MAEDKVLLEARFGLAETKRNIWFATVPEGVSPEDLLEPSYWAHCAQHNLRPLDEIVVVNDAVEWRVELLVEDAWHSGARVQELSRQTLKETQDAENEAGLAVKWRGPHSKYSVVRRDGTILKDKLPSREIALQHMTAMSTTRVA